LWRHTCFEAFVRTSPGEAYYEFNFAPSTQWAAYHFSGYRSGMRVATEIGPPVIQTQANATSYTLQVLLKLGLLPSLPGAAPWRLGLSAVIEETRRPQIVLGVGASAGQAGLPSARLLYL
jgi:hypothetical protein